MICRINYKCHNTHYCRLRLRLAVCDSSLDSEFNCEDCCAFSASHSRYKRFVLGNLSFVHNDSCKLYCHAEAIDFVKQSHCTDQLAAVTYYSIYLKRIKLFAISRKELEILFSFQHSSVTILDNVWNVSRYCINYFPVNVCYQIYKHNWNYVKIYSKKATLYDYKVNKKIKIWFR